MATSSVAAGGLTAVPVVTGLDYPAMFTIAGDGRIFYSERTGGRVGVFDPGIGTSTSYVTVPDLCTDSDQGLYGLALHPDFPNPARLFAYATRRLGDGSCENQISRSRPRQRADWP